jgi:hypothetical protein
MRSRNAGFQMMSPRRHCCEPTGPRFARPDDRLREAIQLYAPKRLDCFGGLRRLAIDAERLQRTRRFPARAWHTDSIVKQPRK